MQLSAIKQLRSPSTRTTARTGPARAVVRHGSVAVLLAVAVDHVPEGQSLPDESAPGWTFASVDVSLPIADRRRSHDFYRKVLGVDALGEPGDDGIAEPLQFPLNEGMRLMLIPAGGFGWVIPRRERSRIPPRASVRSRSWRTTRPPATSSRDEQATPVVRSFSKPGAQPWAYTATFTDPDGHLWSVMKRPDAG